MRERVYFSQSVQSQHLACGGDIKLDDRGELCEVDIYGVPSSGYASHIVLSVKGSRINKP